MADLNAKINNNPYWINLQTFPKIIFKDPKDLSSFKTYIRAHIKDAISMQVMRNGLEMLYLIRYTSYNIMHLPCILGSSNNSYRFTNEQP